MHTHRKKLLISDYSFCGNTHFTIIKGISILLIVLVHLCNRYLNFGFLSPFAGAGVGVFLLCSGYGLSESFLNKGGLKDFWGNKLIKIWIPSFLKITLFAVLTGSGIYVWVTEYPLFLYGWYLQVLFGEYLVFWLLFRFVKNKTVQMIGLFAVSAFAFVLIRSQLYAEQLLCFPLGVLFSQMKYKEKTEKWNSLKKTAFILSCCVIAAVAFVFRKRFTNYLLINFIWLCFKVSLAVLICFLPYYMRKLKFFGIFIPLGIYSYMLYLLNNHVLELLAYGIQWYRVLMVLLVLALSAVAFKFVCDQIHDFYRKMISKINLKGRAQA